MSSWSKRRKSLYMGVAGIIVLGAVVIPAYAIFYHKPTCFDGIQNGKELNVDCGGACEKLCQSDFLDLSDSWTRAVEVAHGYYNVAAYISNPNIDGEARNVPFHFVLFDAEGILITDVPGTMTIPPQRDTLAFLTGVKVGERIPARATFEITGAPQWEKKPDTLKNLRILDKDYQEMGTTSSLEVTIANTSIQPISRFAVYVVLKDSNDNVIDFSKTIIDQIAGKSTVVAPFTWRTSHNNEVISIDVFPVAE